MEPRNAFRNTGFVHGHGPSDIKGIAAPAAVRQAHRKRIIGAHEAVEIFLEGRGEFGIAPIILLAVGIRVQHIAGQRRVGIGDALWEYAPVQVPAPRDDIPGVVRDAVGVDVLADFD